MEKKLVAGVIGLKMGRHHLKAVIDSGHEVGAICDIDAAQMKLIGDEHGIPEEKRYTDWKQLVDLPLDVVLIVTPDQLHREMSETFLAAGKHVMCEKPLAIVREDLDAIVAAAEKANTKFMVGQICRFTPSFVKAKEIVDTGTIGELYYVESEYAHDYAKILHAWRADPNRHGVVGGGCHAVDLLRWFAGDPLEVFAYGSHKLLPAAPYDDATIAVLKWPNGICGKVFVSTGCKRPYTMRTLFYGTKGTIICDNTSDHMELYTLSEDGIAVNPEPEIIPIDINNHNALKEFEVLADHILNDTPVKMSAREGAKTVATCMAIVESAKTGKPVVPNYEF
ncbi:MAG: Gfo/Idh/MocA family oxidoreductase [Clostridia bacterium]|nr:Gfo/Idh/MocA family oxidoreductase [Clostridia bacterium]